MSERPPVKTPPDPYKIIVGMRATRNFRDEPVSDEELQKILRAGRWAGSAKNAQPWHFVVIRESETLNRLSECGQYAQHLKIAPLAIAIVIDPVRFASFDAGRTAQNMMLAAATMGIGSVPTTMHDEACAKQVLGVPGNKNIQIVLSFGFPEAEQPPKPAGISGKPRKPMEELVHYGHW